MDFTSRVVRTLCRAEDPPVNATEPPEEPGVVGGGSKGKGIEIGGSKGKGIEIGGSKGKGIKTGDLYSSFLLFIVGLTMVTE